MAEDWDTANYKADEEHAQIEAKLREDCLSLALDREKSQRSNRDSAAYGNNTTRPSNQREVKKINTDNSSWTVERDRGDSNNAYQHSNKQNNYHQNGNTRSGRQNYRGSGFRGRFQDNKVLINRENADYSRGTPNIIRSYPRGQSKGGNNKGGNHSDENLATDYTREVGQTRGNYTRGGDYSAVRQTRGHSSRDGDRVAAGKTRDCPSDENHSGEIKTEDYDWGASQTRGCHSRGEDHSDAGQSRGRSYSRVGEHAASGQPRDYTGDENHSDEHKTEEFTWGANQTRGYHARGWSHSDAGQSRGCYTRGGFRGDAGQTRGRFTRGGVGGRGQTRGHDRRGGNHWETGQTTRGRNHWNEGQARGYKWGGNSSEDIVCDSSSSNKEHKSQVPNPMGYLRLQSLLSTKGPDEIMLNLKEERGGFKELLMVPELSMKPDFVALILRVLASATKSTQPRNLASLFAIVCQATQFIYVTLQKYLVNLAIIQKERKDIHLDSICYLLKYLLSFSENQPASSCETVKLLLPNIKDTTKQLLEQGEDLDLVVLDDIEHLEQVNSGSITKYADKDLRKIAQDEKQHMKEPPNSFRSIPIYPTEADLMTETPFLRANIVEGRYIDVEHYLDVQFRLLREDSVRELRDGITEYRNSENGGSIKGLKVYKGVRILYPKCTINGVAHCISFEIFGYLKYLRWETSKRLLEGSLVCLSKDKFQTIIFATVSKRDVEMLKDGLLFVRFEDYDDVIKQIRPFEEFVMVETSAFFEAYRHVLTALQKMHENNFPFKRYIVDLSEDLLPPKYLTDFTGYDLRPLMMPLPEARVQEEGGEDQSEKVFSPMVDYVKKITVLDPKSWPPADDMYSIDQSQMEALRSALTKEVAIIQGPPGTGKTYIGLRIIQVLLQNINIWRRGKNSPILIVCFTNHALDQFLEGVLRFTSSVVRVGGRSTSTLLEDYRLAALRLKYKEKRAFPRELMSNKKEAIMRLEKYEKKINTYDREINKACQEMITEVDLKPYISKEHLRSLAAVDVAMPEFQALFNDNKLILDWLGLRFRGKHAQVWFHEQTKGRDFLQEQPERKLDQAEGGLPLDGDRDYEASCEFYEETVNDENLEIVNAFDDFERSKQSPNSDDEGDEPDVLASPDQYWELNGGNKARRNYLRQQLMNRSMISDEEESSIKNVWDIPLQKRWQLYRLWTARYVMGHYETINELQGQYQEELKSLAELRHACDLYILKHAKIIGMTTTGASKYKDLVQELGPAILIVEEAAEVMEAHIVTCLTKDTQHVIMIGDHQQLRPIPSVYMLAKTYNLDVSLFERLVKNGLPRSQLSIQHRMKPCISKLLVPHIYKVLTDHNDTKKYLEIKGISKSMFFLTHMNPEGNEKDSPSKVNVHEAEFIVKLCKYLIHQGYDTSKISILATYSGQLQLILKLMKSDSLLEQVKATSVDNYQGEENDIILISFVRSNDDQGIGFLKTENRVCVALSRAKKGLYCIGNFRFLAEKSDLWRAITNELELQSAIGPDLALYCQNHPNTICEVRKASDFDSVPEGGCTRLCDIRLPCGHKCPRTCHSYDPDHKEYKCNVTCGKITCIDRHRCPKKCFQCTADGCGPCYFKVLKELQCGHEVKVHCSVPPADALCKFPCTNLLACGHTCPNHCGDKCSFRCDIQVDVLGSCEHTIKVRCFESHNEQILLSKCRADCKFLFSCGHICLGSCSTCYQGRLHQKCKKNCGQTLVCGHPCKVPCSKSCPPCERACENKCKHNKCTFICGVPCQPCREPCAWKCPHFKCTNLCGEICNRPPCFSPCPKKLNCKHPCVGLCGEPCPSLCRKCHNRKLTIIFFGNEEEPNARFLTLEDCGHVFEVYGFFRWLEEEAKQPDIKIPRCPKCKTVIRDSNHCLGNIVKSFLADVNLVKQKAFGYKPNISGLHRDLKITANSLLDRVDKKLNPIIQVVLSNLSLAKLETNRLNCLENYLRMIQQLDTSSQELEESVDPATGKLPLSVLTAKVPLEIQLDDLLKLILEFMMSHCKNPSYQQLKDLDSEVHRFQLISQLVNVAHKADTKKLLNATDLLKLNTVCTTLMIPKPLPADSVDIVNHAIRIVSMSHGIAKLNVSQKEKRVIVRAIGLNQGHWFKCPNGHVYCIGECGGATEVGRCGDCNAVIGGRDHTLETGNSLADEMDGAAFAAYSETANLLNFDPGQFTDNWLDRED